MKLNDSSRQFEHWYMYLVRLSYLLYQVNGWLKVKTKINELPLNSFPLVFLLLQDEHLQTFSWLDIHSVPSIYCI